MPKKTSGEKKKKKEEKKKQKKNENKVKIDPTFGLKNKKGSKNRRFVQNAQNNMNAEDIRKKQERQKKKKEKEYLARMKREEEALFHTVDNDPQFKNKKNKKNKNNQDNQEQKIEIDDETLLNNCHPSELDILIDKLRVKFDNRTDLTPVNPETFKIWLEKKEAEKKAISEAKTKKKLQKKGKKGLTGRELFSLTPNIFTDDDNATETIIFEKQEEEQKNNQNNNNIQNINKSEKNDKNIEKNKNIDKAAAVDDIGDASLFLEMDDMLDEMEIID